MPSPWLVGGILGSKGLKLTAADTVRERSVEGQQYDRSKGSHQNRPDVEPGKPRATEQLHDEPSDQCSYHPDDDGEQEAAGVPARHDQLAQNPRNKPDDDPAYDAYAHLLLLPPFPSRSTFYRTIIFKRTLRTHPEERVDLKLRCFIYFREVSRSFPFFVIGNVRKHLPNNEEVTDPHTHLENVRFCACCWGVLMLIEGWRARTPALHLPPVLF